MHAAVASGNLRCAEVLLELRAEADAQDSQGETPLHYAALTGQADCARLLLLSRADPDRESFEAEAAAELAEQNAAYFLAVSTDEVLEVLRRGREQLAGFSTPVDASEDSRMETLRLQRREEARLWRERWAQFSEDEVRVERVMAKLMLVRAQSDGAATAVPQPVVVSSAPPADSILPVVAVYASSPGTPTAVHSVPARPRRPQKTDRSAQDTADGSPQGRDSGDIFAGHTASLSSIGLSTSGSIGSDGEDDEGSSAAEEDRMLDGVSAHDLRCLIADSGLQFFIATRCLLDACAVSARALPEFEALKRAVLADASGHIVESLKLLNEALQRLQDCIARFQALPSAKTSEIVVFSQDLGSAARALLQAAVLDRLTARRLAAHEPLLARVEEAHPGPAEQHRAQSRLFGQGSHRRLRWAAGLAVLEDGAGTGDAVQLGISAALVLGAVLPRALLAHGEAVEGASHRLQALARQLIEVGAGRPPGVVLAAVARGCQAHTRHLAAAREAWLAGARARGAA